MDLYHEMLPRLDAEVKTQNLFASLRRFTFGCRGLFTTTKSNPSLFLTAEQIVASIEVERLPSASKLVLTHCPLHDDEKIYTNLILMERDLRFLDICVRVK